MPLEQVWTSLFGCHAGIFENWDLDLPKQKEQRAFPFSVPLNQSGMRYQQMFSKEDCAIRVMSKAGIEAKQLPANSTSNKLDAASRL